MRRTRAKRASAVRPVAFAGAATWSSVQYWLPWPAREWLPQVYDPGRCARLVDHRTSPSLLGHVVALHPDEAAEQRNVWLRVTSSEAVAAPIVALTFYEQLGSCVGGSPGRVQTLWSGELTRTEVPTWARHLQITPLAFQGLQSRLCYGVCPPEPKPLGSPAPHDFELWIGR